MQRRVDLFALPNLARQINEALIVEQDGKTWLATAVELARRKQAVLDRYAELAARPLEPQPNILRAGQSEMLPPHHPGSLASQRFVAPEPYQQFAVRPHCDIGIPEPQQQYQAHQQPPPQANPVYFSGGSAGYVAGVPAQGLWEHTPAWTPTLGPAPAFQQQERVEIALTTLEEAQAAWQDPSGNAAPAQLGVGNENGAMGTDGQDIVYLGFAAVDDSAFDLLELGDWTFFEF